MQTPLHSLGVQIYADGADKAGILELYSNSLIKGMTTNPTLMKKAGSGSPRRVFRAMLREIIQHDHLPGYTLTEEPGDIICVQRRRLIEDDAPVTLGPTLSPATQDAARDLAPGWDVYALEAEWRAFWVSSGRPRLTSADKAYLGWVKGRVLR